MPKLSRNIGSLDFGKVQKIVADLKPESDPRYNKFSDQCFACLFSDVFSEVARYNTSAKEWFFYDGVAWKKDVGSMKVETCAKLLADALIIYSAKVDGDYFRKNVAKLGDRKKRTTMIADARDLNFITNEDLDADGDLFNCLNCVIRLSTGECLDHDPDLLLSKVSNVVYDPNAKSKDFEVFLSEVMIGDLEKISYLRELCGYALMGENVLEQMYMIYGSTTRNGKSTFLEVLDHLFGDYAKTIAPESLAQKDRNSRTASGDIARLDGVRFLHMSEPPKKMKIDTALLKSLTGRDKITARNLYEAEFEFYPIFKLFVNTNYLPVVTDDTLFGSGRVKVISFDRHFTPEEQDPRLKSRLKSRDNISGIFNWCLSGLRSFQDHDGLIPEPEAVKKATEEYRQKSDKIQTFIDEALVEDPGAVISLKACYLGFEAWCRNNGYGVENKGNFTSELRTKGLISETGTINGVTVHNVVKGFRVDPDLEIQA